MIINEILTSKIENYQTTVGNTYFYTSADINDKRYEFSALRYVTHTPDYWLVQFEYKEKDLASEVPRYKEGEIERTGSGDEFKVFSFVKKSMEDFFNHYSPNIVLFSSSDSYRSNLYKKLVDRYVPSNYNLEEKKNPQTNSSIFILRKQNAVR